MPKRRTLPSAGMGFPIAISGGGRDTLRGGDGRDELYADDGTLFGGRLGTGRKREARHHKDASGRVVSLGRKPFFAQGFFAPGAAKITATRNRCCRVTVLASSEHCPGFAPQKLFSYFLHKIFVVFLNFLTNHNGVRETLKVKPGENSSWGIFLVQKR